MGMKAITSAVSMVMMLAIVVSIVGLSYGFIAGYFGVVTKPPGGILCGNGFCAGDEYPAICPQDCDLDDYYYSRYHCYKESYTPSCEKAEWGNELFLKINGSLYTYPNTSLYAISYESDGLKQWGLMFLPRGTGTYPLVVFAHGGTQGVPEVSLMYNFDIAEKGYIVLAPSYRGEPLIQDDIDAIEVVDSDGNLFNNQSEGDLGDPSEVHDVLNLIECGKGLPKADSSIFVYGSSHGGLHALLVPERIQKINATAILYGWLGGLPAYKEFLKDPEAASERIFTPEFRALAQPEQLAWINKMDPNVCLDDLQSPALIMVGDQDAPFIYDTNVNLESELLSLDKDVQLVVFNGEGHSFNWYVNSFTRSQASKDSFDNLTNHFETNI